MSLWEKKKIKKNLTKEQTMQINVRNSQKQLSFGNLFLCIPSNKHASLFLKTTFYIKVNDSLIYNFFCLYDFIPYDVRKVGHYLFVGDFIF